MNIENDPLISRQKQDKIFRRRLISLLFLLTIILSIYYFWTFLIIKNYQLQNRYMLFVRRWPPTVCYHPESCIKEKNNFDQWVIHGLWPENSDNTYDSFCTKEKLDLNNLTPIKDRLKKIWPNLLARKTPESLWIHEWDKHGTCTQMHQLDYFNKTLNLYYEYNVDQSLRNANIIPNESHQYSHEQFKKALLLANSNLTMDNYVLNCKRIDSNYYIDEIWLCVSYEHPDLLLNHCTVESTCPEKFYYTGFQQ
ncbi:Ribonuclease DdI [Sarcoptes scabiei]|uniref:Ribonuclease DdI n=2 Tax=Sarcoptes scabiei TaxID=52283 RepID=A0A834RDW7_SARSC|nr:Ribonuclease DdI [Sarcoptes scabiei]